MVTVRDGVPRLEWAGGQLHAPHYGYQKREVLIHMSRGKVLGFVLLVALLGFSAISYAADNATHKVTVNVPEQVCIMVGSEVSVALNYTTFDTSTTPWSILATGSAGSSLQYYTNVAGKKITVTGGTSDIPTGMKLTVGDGTTTVSALDTSGLTLVTSCIVCAETALTLTYSAEADSTVPKGSYSVDVTYTITN